MLGQGPGGAAPKTPSPPADYSAEALVVERMDTVYRFAADGTGSREITTVTRIQSDAAARQFGVLNFAFAGNSEHVEIDYVRVRKPDGSVVETPASDAQEMPQEVTRQAPFYSDLKEKQIPVRNLRMGDKLEYKVRIVGTKAEAPGQFWGQDTLAEWAVILSESVELHVPKSKYVKVWSPTVQPAKTESGDEMVYRWTGSQLEPTTGKDSKLKQKEIDPKGELPTMAWTTFKSWEEVGSWYRGLESDRATPDAEIKAKTAELIAGKTTDDEKARALYGYVATQIRYIGVAFGIGRYQPHPAGEVLRNQYGDCKDKHTLLAAMLTAAGLHPSAALIGAGIRMNEEVPSPSAFNHMITTVPVAGRQIWLDTTAEIAPYEMLVSMTRDKQALVVPDAGVAKIEKTPEKLPFASFSRFVGKGTLSKDGTMKAQIDYTTRGDDELVLRTLLRQVSPGQWDELSQRLSQGLGFSGTTSHTEAGKPDATAEPARISYDYEREKTGDWDNHRILPLFPPIFLAAVDEKNPPKTQPIQLGEPRVETSVSTIKLPAGWGADLPATVHQKTAFATFDKTYKIEGDTLTTERRLEILQREVPAADWKAYKKWMDASIGESEPFIALIGTDSKASDSGPASSTRPNQEIAAVLREFYEQIQRGQLNAAEQTLTRVQQLEPNSIWYYRGQVQVQAMKGNAEEVAEALRHVLKMDGVTDLEKNAAAEVFYSAGHYDEALPWLEKQAAKDSENETVQLHLGVSQMRTGGTTTGSKTLLALLEKSTEELTLNDAAYELARADIELEKAEKAARSVIDTLTKESSAWAVGDTTKLQPQRQSLLIAAWDTLGWVLYREGKVDEAANYVRAAWNNEQKAEVGLHLGKIEEKQGHSAAALGVYEIAIATFPPETLVTPSALARDQKRKLQDHIAALKKQGVVSQVHAPQLALQKLKTLPLGAWKGKNSMAEYAFILQKDKVDDLQESDAGKAPIVGANAIVRRAAFDHWVPKGSEARLLRKGTLNCHMTVCDLVVHPM